MKKGKKGWILLMAFTTWTVLITGCGKWLGNKPDTMPEDTTVGADTENTENLENRQSAPLPDIQELTYYVHGTMVHKLDPAGGRSARTGGAMGWRRRGVF